MALEVKFYKCSNAPNEYPKTFTDEKTKQCTLLEPTSTKAPTLKLEIDSSLKGYTHCKIWGDTYILNNDFSYDKGFMYINCVRSATDTYWSTIAGCSAHITRCADGEEMLMDELATQYENDLISCHPLGVAFSGNYSYIWVKGVTNAPIVN